jgi:hypothetical protein
MATDASRDFDTDRDVDGGILVSTQRVIESAKGPLRSDGDADSDHDVDLAELQVPEGLV